MKSTTLIAEKSMTIYKRSRLRLNLNADIGIIGLPNAGKSSFLKFVTNASPKIADYPFTTLFPNLGVIYNKDHQEIILADIPGIIKNAYKGLGLGLKFLGHVEKPWHAKYEFYNDTPTIWA